MSLVPSLLQAIVGLNGEALVIHVGEKPYVVTPTGQVDLATRGLTLEAVSGILGELLPVETQHALDEFGAIQYEFPPSPEFRHEHFTVVAARGGDDVWVEIRRRRAAEEDHVPAELFAAPQAGAGARSGCDADRRRRLAAAGFRASPWPDAPVACRRACARGSPERSS